MRFSRIAFTFASLNCLFFTKVRLQFGVARVSCPVGSCALPNYIFLIDSGTSFDQKPDNVGMAAQRSLVQRR